jgi:uncharacterized membrane protein
MAQDSLRHITEERCTMEPTESVHVYETFRLIVEWTALGIELIAVIVIVAGVVILAVRRGTIRYLFQLGKHGPHEIYKHQLGKALLLGLELLVAAMWFERLRSTRR